MLVRFGPAFNHLQGMNVAEAITTRRSVKVYDPTHQMSDAEVRMLVEHAMLSPTAFNLQHWRFVAVRDPQIRKAIRAVAWDQPQVTDASLLLVLCMDLQAWQKQPERYWRNAPQEIQGLLLPGIERYYKDNPQVQRDEGMRSCGIAAMTIMLLAREMGYDSCPMDGFDFDTVAELINLPPDHAICMMIAVGQKLEDAFARGGQLELDDVFFTDHF